MPRPETGLPTATVRASTPPEPAHQKALDDALAAHAHERGPLLPVLHAVHDTLGWIPASLVGHMASALQLSRAEVQGVISFYPHFRQQPPARVNLAVCRAEACQSMGANPLYTHATAKAESLPAGTLHVEAAYCLGLCAQSPAVLVNGKPFARLSPARLDDLIATEAAG